MNSQRILITGATGYIGKSLAESLVANHRVKVLVRKSSSAGSLINLGAEPVWSDLSDIASLEKAIDDVDIVYHLAEAKGSPKNAYEINVKGTKALIDFSETRKVKRFVFASTVAVMGAAQKLPADEDQPYDPYHLYFHAVAKTECEQYGFKKFRESGFPFSVIRPCAVYGKSSPVVAAITDWMKKHERIGVPLLGNGNNTAHFAHIDDITQAFILSGFKKEAIGNVYIIVDDTPVSWNDFLEVIACRLDIKLRTRKLPVLPLKILNGAIEFVSTLTGSPRTMKPYIYFFTNDIHFSNNKAKRELGFKPKYPNPIEGIRHEIY